MELAIKEITEIKRNNSEKYIFNREDDYLTLKAYFPNLKSKKYIKNLNSQIKEYSFLGKKNNLLSKKIKLYRGHLTQKLNTIHNVHYNVEYWGFLIDSFLTDFVGGIISQVDSLQSVKKKFKNTYINYLDYNYCAYNSIEVHQALQRDVHVKQIFTAKIANILNLKIIGKKIKQKKFYQSQSTNIFRKIVIFFFTKFIEIFFKVFRPNFIVSDYIEIKKKNLISIQIFKNFYIPSYFFNSRKKFNINKEKRFKLLVPEKDIIDKSFNKLIINFFPSSYLENYIKYKKKIEIFAKYSNSFICSTSYRVDDSLKILAAELKLRKKKLIYISHAPFENLRTQSRSFNFCKKYHDEIYRTTETNYGRHVSYNLKKYQVKKNKSNIKIIIYDTVSRTLSLNKFLNSSLETYPTLNSNILFYQKLNKENKNTTMIKTFPSNDIREQISKNIWTKFSLNKKNIISKRCKFDELYDYDILILNEFSTPLFEALLTYRPFILIYGNIIDNLNQKTKENFLKLKKLKIIFKKPNEAATFLNKNKSKYYDNWKNVIENKNYLNFRKIIIN